MQRIKDAHNPSRVIQTQNVARLLRATDRHLACTEEMFRATHHAKVDVGAFEKEAAWTWHLDYLRMQEEILEAW